MQVSHWSSGALVGSLARTPAVATALGVATHVGLDSVPHHWPASFAAKVGLTVADYSAALAGLVAIAPALPPRRRRAALWGVAGSAAVDLVLVGVAPARRNRLGRWHSGRQPHRARSRWLVTDAFVTAVCVAALLGLRHRPSIRPPLQEVRT